MREDKSSLVSHALDRLSIELPSWGFANTGTRFGKFIQAGAATNIEEKLADAAQVHSLTGCCPSVAVHVAWDFPAGLESAPHVAAKARSLGVRIGSVNPTLFEDQSYKYGSLCNPDPAVRARALSHVETSVRIMRAVGSDEIVLWLADGSNYPGTANIRDRKKRLEEAIIHLGGQLEKSERLLIEYKPFEPAFYHTDVADWGMALLLARKGGTRARVLVDLGHHYPGQNIEQIVAWLLDEEVLGGFHFNDRRYADDDLTVGSIDPYQVFRILYEIGLYEWETNRPAAVGYMVDQSHNLKEKIEAMLQTVTAIQELAAKAALVDFASLASHHRECRLIDAEECLKAAYGTDVRPLVRTWRQSRNLPEDPLAAFRESGYLRRIERERGAKNRSPASSYV
jgi:L-rhamnose isomerase / sugar isomerase